MADQSIENCFLDAVVLFPAGEASTANSQWTDILTQPQGIFDG